MRRRRAVVAFLFLAVLSFQFATVSRAAEDPALKAALLKIALSWEHIKFEETNKNLQEQQMAAVAEHAAAVAQQFHGHVEAQIWLGIIISEQASMAGENGSPFKALSFAKHAREILEPIAKQYPAVLDAGAPTSLGVLYSRVPGFPIAFGDKAKARALLQEAIKYAPDGLDANYFYGDFLYSQHEYPAAQQIFKHALSLPPHPDRPIWEKSRRLVMQEDLVKMQNN